MLIHNITVNMHSLIYLLLMSLDPFQRFIVPWNPKYLSKTRINIIAYITKLLPRQVYNPIYKAPMLPYRIKYNGYLISAGAILLYCLWNRTQFYSGKWENRKYFTTELSPYNGLIRKSLPLKFQKLAQKQTYII